MTITGMKEFENVIYNEAVKYFNANRKKQITEADVFTVWSCKTLQNYKALVSTNVAGDTTYFEFTYNGDKQQLYMDAYVKEKMCVSNKRHFREATKTMLKRCDKKERT